MSTIAMVGAGVVAAAAYSYFSTPSVVPPPSNQFQEQTPSNPAGYPPSMTSTTGGPTAPTPVAPSIPSAIVPVAAPPVVPVPSSIPQPVQATPVTSPSTAISAPVAAPAPSVSTNVVSVPMECAIVKPDGSGGIHLPAISGYNATQCAAYNNQMAGTGNSYGMVPVDRVQTCIIS